MADSEVILNPGANGARMDEEAVDYGGTTRLRSRIVLGGSLPGELAKVRNTLPATSDYGVVVRPVDAVSTSTVVTAIPASLTAVELGDANSARMSMTVYNDTETGRLFLKFGADASVESFSNILEPGDYWESSPPRHTGILTAAWDVADGAAHVTEFLA